MKIQKRRKVIRKKQNIQIIQLIRSKKISAPQKRLSTAKQVQSYLMDLVANTSKSMLTAGFRVFRLLKIGCSCRSMRLQPDR